MFLIPEYFSPYLSFFLEGERKGKDNDFVVQKVAASDLSKKSVCVYSLSEIWYSLHLNLSIISFTTDSNFIFSLNQRNLILIKIRFFSFLILTKLCFKKRILSKYLGSKKQFSQQKMWCLYVEIYLLILVKENSEW